MATPAHTFHNECGRQRLGELQHRTATAASPAIDLLNSKKAVPGSHLFSNQGPDPCPPPLI